MLKVEQVLYGRRGYRVRDEHRRYLEAVQRAAEELEASHAALAAAVLVAHEADVPFRAISAAAAISHEQARRIVKAARRR